MDFIEKFKSHLTLELMRSPLTVRAYGDDLRVFETYLDGNAIQNATYGDIRSYVMLMVERGDSARSVNRRMSSLRTFFDFLILSEVITSNPCAKIKALKTEKRLPHFVEKSKIEHLFNIDIGEDNFVDMLIIKLLYYTGIRRAELIALNVNSVDIDLQLVKVIGKGGKERIIPLVDSLADDIERYLKIRGEKICNSEQKALFLNNKGGRIGASAVYGLVRYLLTIDGVAGKRSPHVLRHTFATHLTAAGVGVRDIQQLLGHSSIATTQMYAHNTIETLKASYNKAHPRASKTKKL